mgnify:CR=1 FL=1
MSYFRDPHDIWEEGTADAIQGLFNHGSNIRKEWRDRLTPQQKALLNEFQEELIKRLSDTVFPEVK